MPELPEVEAARLALEEHTKGKLIVRAVVAEDTTVINGVSPLDLQQALTGKRIENVSRKGKNMWLELDERPWPSFQFGMAGAIHIKGVQGAKYKRSAVEDEEWPSKYYKVLVELEDGQQFAFTDTRRFARVRLLEDPKSSAPISELGPDAYLELLNEDDFSAAVGNKKGSIKALLLDQSFLSGIGNWVADEVLYQARIHPEQVASSLSKEQCSSLRSTIVKVLDLAVQVNADSARFPMDWIFHYRWGKKPGSVDGHNIDFIKVGGRTSAYVPELQKLTGPLEGEKPARKRGSVKKASEAAVVSEDSPAKGRGKGLKKTKTKSHESSDDEDSVKQGTDEDEDPSPQALKKRGRTTKGNTTVDKEEVELQPEKEFISGAVVATAQHNSSLGVGGTEFVARGFREACHSKSAWSPVDAGQGFGFVHHGSQGLRAARAPGAFVGMKQSYHAPQVRRRAGITTCFIRTYPVDKRWVKGGVASLHRGPHLSQGFKACMCILKRPACFV